MLRWLKTILATICWSFILVGAVGLAEGVSQWVRFDLIDHQTQPLGLVRLWVPYVVLYGWFGVLCAMLVMLPAGFIACWQTRSRSIMFSLSLAGALSALVVVYVCYIGRIHLLPEWWEQQGGVLVNILLGLVWLGVVWALYRPLRWLANWMAQQKTRTLVFPVVVIIVVNGLWPDWREEGRIARTSHLERVALPDAVRQNAPHLILVSIDTWRRDHLSLINPLAPPTPHLNALAKEGILFTNVWSVSPWTLPSMATIMSGLPPRALQLRKYVPLPDNLPLLAEVAWRQGYRTTAFATNPYLTTWYGFDRGFDLFLHSLVIETLLPVERSVLAREVNYHAVTYHEPNDAKHIITSAGFWLRRYGEGTPLFLWIHLMNPHLPYRWRDLPPPQQRLQDGRGQEPDLAQIPDDGWFAGHQYKGVMHIRKGIFVPDTVQREVLHTLYAREVEYSDYWVGRLFTELQKSGLWDNAVVVVLADHGEEFWEHGGFEHGHSVMPEVCGVPLIIRLPRGEGGGRVIADPVTTLDVMPTLCQLMGWPQPPGLPGTPLRLMESKPATDAAAPAPMAYPCLLENLLYDPQQQGVFNWPWLRVQVEGEADCTWYDLATDPTANRPISAPVNATHLLARADSVRVAWDLRAEEFTASTDAETVELPEDLKRSLKSLGY